MRGQAPEGQAKAPAPGGVTASDIVLAAAVLALVLKSGPEIDAKRIAKEALGIARACAGEGGKPSGRTGHGGGRHKKDCTCDRCTARRKDGKKQ